MVDPRPRVLLTLPLLGGLSGPRVCVGCEDSRRTQDHDSNVRGTSYVGTKVLCAATLAVLLVFVGVEQNRGPGVEAESFMQFSCSWCDRNLKRGTSATFVDFGVITAVGTLRCR